MDNGSVLKIKLVLYEEEFEKKNKLKEKYLKWFNDEELEGDEVIMEWYKKNI